MLWRRRPNLSCWPCSPEFLHFLHLLHLPKLQNGRQRILSKYPQSKDQRAETELTTRDSGSQASSHRMTFTTVMVSQLGRRLKTAPSAKMIPSRIAKTKQMA